MRKSRPKFKTGQVVRVLGCTPLEADEYGIVSGFDDGRWHVNFGHREYKIVERVLRPLTRTEKGN